jgi:hypothetical protein
MLRKRKTDDDDDDDQVKKIKDLPNEMSGDTRKKNRYKMSKEIKYNRKRGRGASATWMGKDNRMRYPSTLLLEIEDHSAGRNPTTGS